MRFLAIALSCLWLSGPLQAAPVVQPSPPPVPTSAQIDQLQGVLSKYATRLLALNRQRQLLTRMRGLVTPDQEAVLRQVRVTPDQSMKLLGLLQEALPQVALGREDTEVLKERMAPRVMEILGPEQADLLLQLTPSPQQMAQLQDLLRESNALWRSALPTSEEVSHDLLPFLQTDQQQWLDMFQSMFKTR